MKVMNTDTFITFAVNKINLVTYQVFIFNATIDMYLFLLSKSYIFLLTICNYNLYFGI